MYLNFLLVIIHPPALMNKMDDEMFVPQDFLWILEWGREMRSGIFVVFNRVLTNTRNCRLSEYLSSLNKQWLIVLGQGLNFMFMSLYLSLFVWSRGVTGEFETIQEPKSPYKFWMKLIAWLKQRMMVWRAFVHTKLHCWIFENRLKIQRNYCISRKVLEHWNVSPKSG